jgi:hypothetical protein
MHSDRENLYAEHTRTMDGKAIKEDVPLRVLENPFADPETPTLDYNNRSTQDVARESFTDVDIDDTDKTLAKKYKEVKPRFTARKGFCGFGTRKTSWIFLLILSVTLILGIVLTAVVLEFRSNRADGPPGDKVNGKNGTGIATLNSTGIAVGGMGNLTLGFLQNASADAAHNVATAVASNGGSKRARLF